MTDCYKKIFFRNLNSFLMLTQNVIFRANSQQYVRVQSKNLYYSKRDVSTTVDMTSSRLF